MKINLKERWTSYWQKKGWFSKISDLIFILLLIGMLIPASRREISAFMAGLTASSPKPIDHNKQSALSSSEWDWQLLAPDGQRINLSQFKGQAILVNFWATWCPPCIAEMPALQELFNTHSGKINFVLISDEKPETIQQFMEKRGFNMPVYHQLSATPPAFLTNSIPTTWIISSEGKITIRKTGAAKWSSRSMQEMIEKLQ